MNLSLSGLMTYTTPRDITHFARNHFEVLRSIDKLRAGLEEIELPRSGGVAKVQRECKSAFTLLFRDETRKVFGPAGGDRDERVVRMNRDGFALLAMGFTGASALRWKLAYIEAFNQLERQVAQQRREEVQRLIGLTTHVEPIPGFNEAIRRRLTLKDTFKLQQQSQMLLRQLLDEPTAPGRRNLYHHLRQVNETLGIPTEALADLELPRTGGGN
ncbi:MAG: Rha family transcriptional regulator [Pseudomonadota bacterium]